jgi:hypothetical protein
VVLEMKGRSPFNKLRKEELHKYLMEKEKVRWTLILSDFRKLKWGPTTLKETLDDMVKDGIIYREIKDSQKGPEVWYCLSLPKLQGKKVFEKQKKGFAGNIELFPLEELKAIEPSFRRGIFPLMLQLYLAQFINYFFLTALTKFREPTFPKANEILQFASEYSFDIAFRDGFQRLVNFVLAFPEDTQYAIAKMMDIPYMTAWVEGRDEELLKETDEVLKKLKELYISRREDVTKLLESMKDKEKKSHSKGEKMVLQKLIESLESIDRRITEGKEKEDVKA